MTSEQLRQVLRAEPFRPFVIHLANGRQLRVKHPEFVSQSPTGRTFVVWGAGEALEFVDGLLVAGIEVPNGKARPRKP
jgi:hypothetical protein